MGNVTLQERVKSTKLIKEERELFLEKNKVYYTYKKVYLGCFWFASNKNASAISSYFHCKEIFIKTYLLI